MNTTIYCKSTGHDETSFYLRKGSEEYYLFTQGYKHGVHSYYAGGVNINAALDYSRGRNDNAITRTMEKLPKYIIYIEKEYDIAVLDKTKKIRKLCA